MPERSPRTDLPILRLREWLALKIAPSLFVPYREDREEAFRELAEYAYGSRDAVWTSPQTLVRVALREAKNGRSLVHISPRDPGRRW